MHKHDKLDALTALRFFAAFAIVIIHARGFGLLPKEFLREWPFDLGVSFFFVLSGFVLTYSYPKISSASDRNRFWVARLAKLWPLHIVTLAILAIFVGGNLGAFGPSHVSYLTLGTYFTLTHAWFAITNLNFALNAPTWSISVEAFFYLLFPWLVRDLSVNWKIKLAASLLIAVVIQIGAAFFPHYKAMDWSVTAESLCYWNPISRLPEFIAGMCMAVAYGRFAKTLSFGRAGGTAIELGAITLFVVLATVRLHTAVLPRMMLVLPATCLLIFAFALQRGLLSQAMRWRPIVFLGEISFAIYMLHYVLLLGYMANASALQAVPISWIAGAFFILTACGAALLHRYIEKPAQRWMLSAYDSGFRAYHRDAHAALPDFDLNGEGLNIEARWR